MTLYEQKVRSLRKDLERHRGKQAAEEQKAARAGSDAARYEAEAARATIASTTRSKHRQAETKRNDANRAREAAAKALKGVAETEKRLHEAEHRLGEERGRDARSQRARELRARERRDAALDKRTRAIERRVPPLAPEKLTVLFISSSPEDQEQLRVDKEVREILQRLRASDHRDAVRFEWRPATQVQDLLQILAEVKPDIVHFSGHGDGSGLSFEDDDGHTKNLSNELLAALLRTSSDRIRLAVFNSCSSSDQAELACQHVDAAIGMSTSVEDESAKIFAGQLYSAIGFGRSLESAFEQARLQVEIATGSVSGGPQLFARAGLSPAEIVLVAPPKESSSALRRPAADAGPSGRGVVLPRPGG